MITFDTLLDNYYDKIKDSYPNLTRAELSLICRNPFSFLKKKMKQVNVPSVRFQYFGVFTVKPGSFSIRPEAFPTERGKAKIEKLQAVIDYNNQNKYDKESQS